MLKKLFYIVFFFLTPSHLISQVFNCNVSVIAPALQSNPANNEIIASLKNAIIEYVNYGYTWTNDQFEKGEQIDVSFLLKIDKLSVFYYFWMKICVAVFWSRAPGGARTRYGGHG